MIKKPGTAVPLARPAGRSKNRNTNKSAGGRKNSRVACEGNAYNLSAFTKTRESSNGLTLRNIPSTKASDAQKDGFFTHKRGHDAYSSKNSRNNSNDKATFNASKQKNIEQLAREGAAQAIASGRLDTDDEATSELTFKNDTTAISDIISLQNFSYYGRRFQDRQPRQSDSPIASDAVSIANPKYNIAMSAVNKGIQSKLPPK